MTTGEADEAEQPGTQTTTDTADKSGKNEAEQGTETDTEEEAAEDPEAGEEQEDDGEEQTDESAEAGEEPPAKPVGRAQARIQRQAAELKTERAEKEKLIAERATFAAQLENLRQQQRDGQTQEQRREEEQRLSLLTPEEKRVYQAEQKLHAMEHRLNQMEVRRADDADRANFHAKATYDETYSKYADQVEQMYQDGLARGVQASREDLLAYRVGKELLKNKSDKAADKRKAAGKRIDSVTAKPANAKGDVAGTKKGKSEEDRLHGVLI